MSIKMNKLFNIIEYIPELGINTKVGDEEIEVVYTIVNITLEGSKATVTYKAKVRGVESQYLSVFNFEYQGSDLMEEAETAMLMSPEFEGAVTEQKSDT